MNSFSVLKWYSSLEEQSHRRSYAYGRTYPLVCAVNTLPPFQIVRNHKTTIDYRAALYTEEGELVMENFDQAISAELQLVTGTSYDVFVYDGSELDISLSEGAYYVVFDDNGEKYYSEVFTMTSDTECYMSIEWWDKETFDFEGGRIYYDGRFKNRLLVKAELGKPEYSYEEEGEERDGLFFPSKQLSTKTYRFSFLAPEYVCDALRLARLSSHVRITDTFGHSYNADSILVTPEWLEDGFLANVVVEFTSASVVKKLGIGYFC